jgi:hypothetical protein
MDICRIPILFITAAAVDKGLTAPNAESKLSERIPVTSAKERLAWAIEIPYIGSREIGKVDEVINDTALN